MTRTTNSGSLSLILLTCQNTIDTIKTLTDSLRIKEQYDRKANKGIQEHQKNPLWR